MNKIVIYEKKNYFKCCSCDSANPAPIIVAIINTQAIKIPKMINIVKVIFFAVSPLGARIAKTIEIESIKIAVKKSKWIYLEKELKNKIEVNNIETKPKYFLITLAFLEKNNYTDYTINKVD
ncbi:hypothetical protein [Bacillus wiedmannii]|uniref:hypothetical protein n=1 Tax=Bacillus wiedmannii TaxID=1890302 RepID=UPI001C557075